MSNDLEKFNQGAIILQQVDVSDIFTSLALGIAEAQEKLDSNSIKQALKLADTSFGSSGKSLLELGFVPSFYSFTSADISASLNLKMALKESISVGLNLNVLYAKTKGYDKEDTIFIDSNKYDSLNGEYKSSKTLAFKANESKSVSIEEKQFSIAQSSKIKSNIRTFKKEIIEQTSAEFILEDIKSKTITKNQSKGVDVWLGGGYLRVEEGIHFNKTNIGLLRISDLDATTIFDIDGDSGKATASPDDRSFKILCESASNVNSGIVYGISKEGKFFILETPLPLAYKEIPSDLYFKFNDDEVLYGESLKNGSETALITGAENNNETEKNHADHIDIHKCLRFIHQFDPSVRFTITGQTDPVGGNSEKNKTLAKRRAESMRNHIFGESSKVNVTFQSITTESGPSDLSKRKASITLNANYIIFLNGNITEDATPGISSPTDNKFVFLEETSAGNKSLDIEYGGVAISKTATIFTEITDEVKKQQYKFKNETDNSGNYFLHEESIVRLSMFTNESKEIKIDTEQNKSETSEEKSDSWISTENKNALNSSLNNNTEEKSNSTFAMSGSIDFRMSKQFEMSMEGNSSMSARLIAVPPPSAFLDELKPE